MSNAPMAPRKNRRSEASKAIAQAIIDQYQPTSAEDMQDALRDIFGPMFEAMLQGEMNLLLRLCEQTYNLRPSQRNSNIREPQESPL